MITETVCYFRGGRGSFETPPHIDTWTNDKSVNGESSVGGKLFT